MANVVDMDRRAIERDFGVFMALDDYSRCSYAQRDRA